MHDVGVFIWAAVLIFGVISSIVRNAQRANARRQAAPPPAAPSAALAPPSQPAVQSPPRQMPDIHAQFNQRVIPGAVMPPVEPVAPPPPVRRPVVRKPEVVVAEPVAPVRTEPSFRGMFGSRPALVQAMIATQVLGPPLALQEHSIWSPRQNGPSI